MALNSGVSTFNSMPAKQEAALPAGEAHNIQLPAHICFGQPVCSLFLLTSWNLIFLRLFEGSKQVCFRIFSLFLGDEFS